MARVQRLPNCLDLPYFYNIDHPVGPGCPNKTEDIEILIYLLTKRNKFGIPQLSPVQTVGKDKNRRDSKPKRLEWVLDRFESYSREVQNAFDFKLNGNKTINPVKNSGKIDFVINTHEVLLYLNQNVKVFNPDAFRIDVVAFNCKFKMQ